jgi:hypothetical protein
MIHKVLAEMGQQFSAKISIRGKGWLAKLKVSLEIKAKDMNCQLTPLNIFPPKGFTLCICNQCG